MAKNSDQVRVALTGSVSVAPYTGSLVLPTDPTAALNASFKDLGYTSTDGVTFNVGVEVEDIDVWQKQTPVRRVVTSRPSSLAFQLAQWNKDTFAVAFGGGTWTETTSGSNLWRYDPPADGDSLAEYAVVIDFVDGDVHGRVVLQRATMNEGVETQLVRNNAAWLPVTFNALTPDDEDAAWYFLSDDDAAFGA